MKTKLLIIIFFTYLFGQAQITKMETFLTGTKVTFYPNECGNTIPEADGKLSFCDRANNLGIVERSYGLNDRRVTQMLPNHYNQDEVYITGKGMSIRNEDGTWENIPNIAVPLSGSQYIPTINNGLVLPDNKLIILASNSGILFNVYDRDLKTFTAVNFPDNKYPQQVLYDQDRSLIWAFASVGNNTYLFTYDSNTLTEIANLGSINISTNSTTLVYKSDHIYLGNQNGLYKIDVSDYTNTVPVTHYDSTTTPNLPYDKVTDLQFDSNDDLWLASNETNDAGIVKFNITNETYDLYQLERPDNPASNIKFQKLALDQNNLIWAVGTNYSGLAKLSFTGATPIWELLPKIDLTTLGVPITYIPNHVYFRNNKFYFTTTDYSSGDNSNYEVIINDNNVWSGRNDDEVGNLSTRMHKRFSENLPDDNGGVWWFNRFDDIVVYRDNEDNHQSILLDNIGFNNQAIDVDNKAIIKGGNPSEIIKIDFPNTITIQSSNNQATAIQQIDNQTWIYDKSIPKIDIYENNNLASTHTLDETDYQYCYYMAVDDDYNPWFMRYINGNQLQIKFFDTTTTTTTSFDRPEYLGNLKKIIAAPNNAIWIIGANGIMYVENGNFHSFLTADYSELNNIVDAVVDTNGKLYLLKNDLAAITTFKNPTTTPILTNLIIENNNSILPSLDHYRPATIAIDSEGSLWTNASQNTFKIIDNDFAVEYRRQAYTASVNQENFITEIQVYPNPTNDLININANITIDNVQVYSILGKKVFEKANSNTLNLGQLNSGVYLLKIFSKNTIINKQILIK